MSDAPHGYTWRAVAGGVYHLVRNGSAVSECGKAAPWALEKGNGDERGCGACVAAWARKPAQRFDVQGPSTRSRSGATPMTEGQRAARGRAAMASQRALDALEHAAAEVLLVDDGGLHGAAVQALAAVRVLHRGIAGEVLVGPTMTYLATLFRDAPHGWRVALVIALAQGLDEDDAGASIDQASGEAWRRAGLVRRLRDAAVEYGAAFGVVAEGSGR